MRVHSFNQRCQVLCRVLASSVVAFERLASRRDLARQQIVIERKSVRRRARLDNEQSSIRMLSSFLLQTVVQHTKKPTRVWMSAIRTYEWSPTRPLDTITREGHDLDWWRRESSG